WSIHPRCRAACRSGRRISVLRRTRRRTTCVPFGCDMRRAPSAAAANRTPRYAERRRGHRRSVLWRWTNVMSRVLFVAVLGTVIGCGLTEPDDRIRVGCTERATAMAQPNGDKYNFIAGLNFDGSVVVGSCGTSAFGEAYRW